MNAADITLRVETVFGHGVWQAHCHLLVELSAARRAALDVARAHGVSARSRAGIRSPLRWRGCDGHDEHRRSRRTGREQVSASNTRAADDLQMRAYLVRTVEQQLLELFAAGNCRARRTLHRPGDVRCRARRRARSAEGHHLLQPPLPRPLPRLDRRPRRPDRRGHGQGDAASAAGSAAASTLCAKGFFSNGIQGGIVPVAAGLAFAQKLAGNDGIVAVCIGDGTLGEGVVYETFNIAAKWQLPLLIVLENNLYAQSTVAERDAGRRHLRARRRLRHRRRCTATPGSTRTSRRELRDAAATRAARVPPAFVRVDTYRLAAHSKGDDDRDPRRDRRLRAPRPAQPVLCADTDAARPRAGSDPRARARAIERAERSAGARPRRANARAAARRPSRWSAAARGRHAARGHQSRAARLARRRSARAAARRGHPLALRRRLQGRPAACPTHFPGPRAQHADQRGRHRRRRATAWRSAAGARSSRSCSATFSGCASISS